ncbi:sugar porter family MFS transporter [Sphingomonas nostoxanthinifaciens]|uniref:sugar porter family MFS transporter n=1 Tax=Sphingomonas nostoxanthinifaciens TaxID=2872652 RepID=UPI001CC1FE88|nr:sugar porter family MFS transporter [Sphingomonas nostoxanthinifaciens]UAK26080.1 sugar porter family MFS transporter [Sphingomonas nostoxanthinifaciens]
MIEERGAPAPAGGEPSLLNPTLLACIVTAALAGLLFGFDTAVISGTTEGLRARFHLDDFWLGVTVSSALWGTLAGALLAGLPGDRFGSRDTLRVLALFYVVGGIGCALAWSWSSLVLFRVIAGLAVGGSSVLAPVYIAEVAPPSRRGGLVASFQFMVIFGILAAYVSNAIIAAQHFGPDDWRWKFGVTAVPAAIFLLLLLRIPNSPRWLVGKGRETEASAAFAQLGMDQARARSEIDAVRAGLGASVGGGEALSWRRHRKPILLAFMVAAFNQLSGINALLYYLNDIFAKAGGSLSPDVQAIIIGVVNAIFTMVGMLLIDRLGRRTLLLIGSAGMATCLVLAGLAMSAWLPNWMLLPALIGFIAFFAPSTGAVIWVYISEVFPTAVRGRGSAIGASTHWCFDAVIAAVFPSIAALSVSLPFFFFAAMMALQFVVVLAYFPETRGVPLEEMERTLGTRK